MLVHDSGMPITKEMVLNAYSMSQMTVINESDPSSARTYSKTLWPEFLEVIARTAHLLFEGSELAEMELKDKI